MFSRRIAIQLLSLALIAVAARAQVQMQLIVRSPAPAQLTTWQRDPSVAQIMIVNRGLDLRQCRIAIEIRSSSGQVIASTNDDARDIPRFDVPGNGKMTKLTGREVLNVNAVRIDRSLYKIAAQTNSLPEGDYTCCVRLLDGEGNEVGSSTEACADVSVVIADPPTLISPIQDQALDGALIQFQWTPVRRSLAEGAVEYELLVVPILGKEAPSIAIERNERLLFKRVQRPEYPLTKMDRPLTANGATRFAWIVRAVTTDGQPCTSNNGFSEVGTFSIDRLQTTTFDKPSARPDTIIVNGYSIAVSHWNPPGEDGLLSGRGCLVNRCATLSGPAVSVPDYGASQVGRQRYTWRKMDVVDNPTDTSSQISTERARQIAGEHTMPGSTLSIPRKRILDTTGTRQSIVSETAALFEKARRCSAVDFEGVRLGTLQGATATIIAGAVTFPSSMNVSGPILWFPSDSFIVEVDTMIITPSSAMAAGSAYHRTATLGKGTGESGRFPFPLTPITAPCEIVANVKTQTEAMFIGESQCAIKAREYVIDFSRTQTLIFENPQDIGIVMRRVSTEGYGYGAVFNNTGYLAIPLYGDVAIIKDGGLSVRLSNTFPRGDTNFQRTTIPYGHKIAYSALDLEFANSTFSGGVFKAYVKPDSRHNVSDPNFDHLQCNAPTNRIESNYTIRIDQELTSTSPKFAFKTVYAGGVVPYVFVTEPKGDARVFGFYPAGWVAPKRWEPFRMPSTSQLVQRREFVGLLLNDTARFAIETRNGRDIMNKPFDARTFVSGRLLIGADGVSGDLSYSTMIDSSTAVVCKVGRIGGQHYKSDSTGFRFFAVRDSRSDSRKTSPSTFDLSFSGDVVTATQMSGAVSLPNESLVFLVPKLDLTSTGDVPAAAVMIDSRIETRNAWSLAIRPALPDQTSMGAMNPGSGVVTLAGATISEEVHFKKPFSILASEFFASGAVGRMVIDANTAGQEFDRFPYAAGMVQLSPVPGPANQQPYLVTSGLVDLPFFGNTQMTIVDSLSTITDRPFRGRHVTVPTTPIPGLPPSDLHLEKRDATGNFSFDITYSDASQDGFFGKGSTDISYLGTFDAELTLRRNSACFSGASSSAGNSGSVAPLAAFGTLSDVWSCACADGDAFKTIGAGGRIAHSPSALFEIIQGGVGLEATVAQHHDVSTTWVSGAAMINANLLVVGVGADARLLFMGVTDHRENNTRGTLTLDAQIATTLAGMTCDAELDFYMGSEAGERVTYIQGAATVRSDVMLLVGGATAEVQGGFFIGYNVPKRLAWVFAAEDARFKLNSDLLPQRLSGLYLYGGVSGYVDALLAGARVDAHVGVGVVSRGLLVTAGVDLHVELLMGLIYGSALVNLQVAVGVPTGLYGRAELQGCINTGLFGKYCASANIGVGMSTQKGFYFE